MQVNVVVQLDKKSRCRRDKKYRRGVITLENIWCSAARFSYLLYLKIPKTNSSISSVLLRMTTFLPLLPTSLLPPTNLFTLLLRGIAQNKVRNWTRVWMRIIKVNIWYSGRIIGFYEKIPCGCFRQGWSKNNILLEDTVDFFEILVPIKQTVWNHATEFIQPIEFFYSLLS